MLEEDFTNTQQQLPAIPEKKCPHQSPQPHRSSHPQPAAFHQQQQEHNELHQRPTHHDEEALNVDDPRQLAERMGVGSPTELMKEQSELLQKAAEEKEHQVIKGALQVPPGESLNIQEQVERMQEYAEDKKREDMRKIKTTAPRAKDYEYDDPDDLIHLSSRHGDKGQSYSSSSQDPTSNWGHRHPQEVAISKAQFLNTKEIREITISTNHGNQSLSIMWWVLAARVLLFPLAYHNNTTSHMVSPIASLTASLSLTTVISNTVNHHLTLLINTTMVSGRDMSYDSRYIADLSSASRVPGQ